MTKAIDAIIEGNPWSALVLSIRKTLEDTQLNAADLTEALLVMTAEAWRSREERSWLYEPPSAPHSRTVLSADPTCPTGRR